MRGALNDVDGAAELVWNATGHEWEAPITEATVTVEGAPVAEVACVRGPPGSTVPCDAAVQGDRGTMRAVELPPGSGATITAVFAAGAIEAPAPIVSERWTIERALVGSQGSVPLAALTALLGLGGVGVLAWREGRDRVTRGGTTIDGQLEEPVRRGLLSGRATPVQYRPPADLRPGQLGVLVDERVDPVDVTATIVDLAVRGHLQIEEAVSGRIRKKKDWTLRRLPAPDDEVLLPYEQLLVDELFAGGDEQALSELEGSWASSYEKISTAMYADAVARGWFTRSPAKTRSLWRGLGTLALVAAAGLTFALARWTTVAIAGVPLILAGLLLMLLSGRMPHRTANGSLRLAETLGFREFISTAEADRMAFAEQENLFLRYLPYAVVFGATAKWAKAFASLGVEEASAVGGAWYLSSDGRPPSFDRLSSSLSDFSSRTATSLTTAPASSGGSGGGSGGGGGGGGGGSW